MLQETVFSFTQAGLPQILGFLIYGTCTVGFIGFLVVLVRM